MAAGLSTSLLNTITLPEMTDLVRREWLKLDSYLQKNARQLFLIDYVGSGNGSTKIYNEIDTETYANRKPEGSNHTKAKVGVGLILAQLKSFLINGENLVVGNAQQV